MIQEDVSEDDSGCVIVAKHGAYIYDVYLYGTLMHFEEYISVIDTLNNASSYDTFNFHINSDGGDLSIALQIKNAIQNSSARTVGWVAGECMSGASVIFLACDDFRVSDDAFMLIHNYSGAFEGKGADMKIMMQATDEWVKDVYFRSYQGFLTEDEINQVLHGKDIYIRGSEIRERVRKMLMKDEYVSTQD